MSVSRAGGRSARCHVGETGLLAKPFDPEDLARCLHRLLTDEPLARRLGCQGRQIVEREYSIPLMRSRYAALYEELIEERRAGRCR